MELATALEEIDVGILCVTRENKETPWLLFEAGSLAKKGEAKVFPFLLGLEYEDLPEALRQFNAVKVEKDEILGMVRSINQAVVGDKLADELLQASFDKWWPDLEAELKAIPESQTPPPPKLSADEMLAKLLVRMEAMPEALSQAVAEGVSANWPILPAGKLINVSLPYSVFGAATNSAEPSMAMAQLPTSIGPKGPTMVPPRSQMFGPQGATGPGS